MQIPQTLNLLLFHAATLRNGAFKLKPIKMSSDLINQLNAVAIKLEECATALQDLIGKKKSKTKHYVGIISEATIVFEGAFDFSLNIVTCFVD